MSKQQKEIIITVILAVVFVFFLTKNIKFIPKKAAPLVAAPVAAAILPFDSGVSDAGDIGEFEKQMQEEKLEWARCPFSGKLYSGSEVSLGLKLTGILLDAQGPLAVINDTVVRKDGKLGKYKIVEILKNKVILNDGTADLELRL